MAVSSSTPPRCVHQLISALSPTKFPAIENLMHDWLDSVSDTNTVLTDALIRAKAREIADKMGYTEDKFKASSGWVENFKARQGIKKGKLTENGLSKQRAQALGWGLLAAPSEPTFKPAAERPEMVWPPIAEPICETVDAGPAPLPEPVPVMLQSEDGQTQEVYVMPKVKVVSEGQEIESLDDAERMIDSLMSFAKKRPDIISSEHNEVLRQIIVNILRNHD